MRSALKIAAISSLVVLCGVENSNAEVFNSDDLAKYAVSIWKEKQEYCVEPKTGDRDACLAAFDAVLDHVNLIQGWVVTYRAINDGTNSEAARAFYDEVAESQKAAMVAICALEAAYYPVQSTKRPELCETTSSVAKPTN